MESVEWEQACKGVPCDTSGLAQGGHVGAKVSCISLLVTAFISLQLDAKRSQRRPKEVQTQRGVAWQGPTGGPGKSRSRTPSSSARGALKGSQVFPGSIAKGSSSKSGCQLHLPTSHANLSRVTSPANFSCQLVESYFTCLLLMPTF